MKIDFKIVQSPDCVGRPWLDIRWVAVDEKGAIVDDAQGYGYKTEEKAYKAAWRKFGGGKAKIDRSRTWWKRHEDFAREALGFYDEHLKEISGGKINFVKEIERLADERGLEDFDIKYLKNLPEV